MLSIKKTIEAYATKKFSPVQVCHQIINNTYKDQTFNGMSFIDKEENLLKLAKESEERWIQNKPKGKLDGIFVSVKDILEVKGWKTLFGSHTFSKAKEDTFDHPSVKRLREEGAIFVGKTTVPTFGWKGVTDSHVYGITRNHHNSEMTSGGSSGGAAVACGLEIAHINLGNF